MKLISQMFNIRDPLNTEVAASLCLSNFHPHTQLGTEIWLRPVGGLQNVTFSFG
jgi:hypothetical protein